MEYQFFFAVLGLVLVLGGWYTKHFMTAILFFAGAVSPAVGDLIATGSVTTMTIITGTVITMCGFFFLTLHFVERAEQEAEAKLVPMTPDRVESDDPLMQQIVATAFNEGGMWMATRDEDGNETIEQISTDYEMDQD